jgi:hypothetical protein
MLSPNIVGLWKAATAPAIASNTLVHSHTDTLFGGLFYDAVNTSSVDNRITVGWWIGKDLEGKRSWPNWDATPWFAWGEISWKISFIITDDPVKIRTRYLPSTCLQLKRAPAHTHIHIHTLTHTLPRIHCLKLLWVGTECKADIATRLQVNGLEFESRQGQ